MSAQLQQGSAEWLDARVGRITGSRVGAILGLSPFASRDDIMREMVREYFGAEREFNGNIATDWGNDNENNAIAQYEAETGSLVISTGFHTSGDMLGASPDGFVGSDGMIEVKCPYSKVIKSLADQQHYAAQIQLQMHCADRKWCDFVSWTPDDFKIERVQRDEMWLVRNAGAIVSFFADYTCAISNKESAEQYLNDQITERDDNEWQTAATDYQRAKSELEKAQAVEASAKKILIKLAGGKKSHGAGLLVYPVSGRKTVKYQDALAKYAPDADLSEFTKQSAGSWSVRIEKTGE